MGTTTPSKGEAGSEVGVTLVGSMLGSCGCGEVGRVGIVGDSNVGGLGLVGCSTAGASTGASRGDGSDLDGGSAEGSKFGMSSTNSPVGAAVVPVGSSLLLQRFWATRCWST